MEPALLISAVGFLASLIPIILKLIKSTNIYYSFKEPKLKVSIRVDGVDLKVDDISPEKLEEILEVLKEKNPKLSPDSDKTGSR